MAVPNSERINIFFETGEGMDYPPKLVENFNEVFSQYDNPFKVVLHREVADITVSCWILNGEYMIALKVKPKLFEPNS